MIGRRDERGVSLILVLVTLVVFGLLVPILGQFGSANGVSGYLIEGQRYDRYAAEAGVQEAIAWAQANRAAGRHGVPCAGLQTGTLGSGNAARSATVTCQGYQGAGVPQATADAPKYALQATGASGPNGRPSIDLGSGHYRTNGAWWSNGAISAPGVDATRDYVGASGSCGSIQAAPKECDQNRIEGAPTWNTRPPESPQVDPRRPVGCSGGGNRVIAIDAGFHWQRRYFDAIADGEDGCDGVVLWLRPGYHVFDFDFYGLEGSSPSFRAASNGHVAVVGGTPSGWSPFGGGSQYPAARSAILARTACDPGQPGAVVVMAHDSYFEINPDGGGNADMQICGVPLSGVPVSFAQLNNGSLPAPRNGVIAPPTGVSTDGHGADFSWQSPPLPASPANPLATLECRSFGGGACDADHVMSGRLTGDRATGTVTMTLADPIPEDAYLTSLRLTVNHREQERDRGIDQIRLWVTGLGDVANRSCDFTQTNHRLDQRDNWPRPNESPDVFTCDLPNEPYVPSGQPVRIIYEVRLDGGDPRDGRQASADLTLDQVTLNASFQEVGYRNATQPSGSQYVLRVNDGARATFDGAIFTPTGNVRFDWAGSTENGFRRGAIVQSIRGDNMPNDPNYSPFELPGGGSYTDRVVTFAATVSGSDQPGAMLTARVLFCDPVPGVDQPRDPKCTGASDEQPYVLAWHTRR